MDPVTLGMAKTDATQKSAAARNFGKSVSRRDTPAFCKLRRGTKTDVPNNQNVNISWNEEHADTEGWHSNSSNTAYIIIPLDAVRSLYRVSVSAEFVANSAGTYRELVLQRGRHDSIGGTTSNIASSSPRPNGTRADKVKITEAIILDPGDTLSVVARQDSGGTVEITGTTANTEFSLERLGPLYDASIGSQGQVFFHSDIRNRGFDRWKKVPANQPASRVYVMDDPRLGARQQIVRLGVTNADNSVTYPRSQLESPRFMTAGRTYCIGFRMRVLASQKALYANETVVVHEVYGDPTNGYGPNVLRIYDNKITYAPYQVYDPTTGAPTGRVPAWEQPLAGQIGKWINIVDKITLSTDPAVGAHEIYADFDGNGLVQQSFKDPNTGVALGSVFNIATLRAGVNDIGPGYSSLKNAYTNYNLGSYAIEYGDVVIADTVALADPAYWGNKAG